MRSFLASCVVLLLSAMTIAQMTGAKIPGGHPSPNKAVTHAPSKEPLSAVPRFEDIAAQAGLTVPHISSPEKKYIVESMSGGAGFIDCDGDGKLDIITAAGSTVDRYKQGGDPMITLYHQDPNLKFSDITKSAGLTRKGWGMGIAVADFDTDGIVDI